LPNPPSSRNIKNQTVTYGCNKISLLVLKYYNSNITLFFILPKLQILKFILNLSNPRNNKIMLKYFLSSGVISWGLSGFIKLIMCNNGTLTLEIVITLSYNCFLIPPFIILLTIKYKFWYFFKKSQLTSLKCEIQTY